MAKDQRLYGKFTLDFPDHPKIAILSDAAFRCLVEATLWSRKQERDGLLARRYAVARWSLDVLQELCSNDDGNDGKPSLIEREEGWYIHDYAEHQDTKADIDARRERNRLAGQKGGLAKGKRSAKQPASNSLSENLAEEEEEEHNSTPNGVEAPPGKRRAKPRTRIPADYMPDRPTRDKIRTEFPAVTDSALRSAHDDFCLYWQGQGRPMADWDATWLRWMRKELTKASPGRNGGGQVHKLRAVADLAREIRAEETAAQLGTATAPKELM